MTNVQTLNDSERQNNFAKAIWLFFKRAKDLQSHHKSPSNLQRIYFCPTATRPTNDQQQLLEYE